MGYVYMAKAAAATPVTTPTGPIVWPPVWPWPPAGWPPLETGGTDPAWPPYGWPTIANWPTIEPDPTTGFEWPDPEDPTSGLDPVWPPAFPPAWPADISDPSDPATTTYSISLSCGATVDVGSALAFTCTTLDDGADTSDLNNHIIVIHATVDGSPVKLKKESGDDYVNMVWYYVSNYSGSSYGLSESVYLDIDATDADKTVTLCATVISTVPIITATDTATVQDNSMYASIAGSVTISATLSSGAISATMDLESATTIAADLTEYSVALLYPWSWGDLRNVTRFDNPFGSFSSYSYLYDNYHVRNLYNGTNYARSRVIWAWTMPSTIIVQPTYLRVNFFADNRPDHSNDDGLTLNIYTLPSSEVPLDNDSFAATATLVDTVEVFNDYTSVLVPGDLVTAGGYVVLMAAFAEEIAGTAPVGTNKIDLNPTDGSAEFVFE